MPADLFDYFVTNQASYIYDHYTHKRWLEVLDAIDRLGDADEDTVAVLKTIGLFNIVGAISNLRSSVEFLEILFDSAKIKKSIKHLESKSIITYRSFSNEYRIWQGSDFDFEQALSHELAQLEDFDLPGELNALMPPLPLVAKRYSVISGALRVINTEYVDEPSLKKIVDNNLLHEPRAFLVLKQGDKLSRTSSKLIESLPKNCIVLDVNSDLRIESQVKELKALKIIFSTYDEIQSDSIARKELSDQIDHRQNSLVTSLTKLLDPAIQPGIGMVQNLRLPQTLKLKKSYLTYFN